ncbi:hypothetical protein CP533_2576 [Ophiocordyceps camponoti-saundersi (nom. inval.)]|nr:hypothetical protein CP533_2576 [Ophiocordyceps camponoti-saundersi (nom. inval.)]
MLFLIRQRLTSSSLLLRSPLLSQTPSRQNLIPNRNQSSDALSDGKGTKGKTGGGPALESTASGAPDEPPKVVNSRVSAVEPGKGLDEEQRREVEEHNRAFERKHDAGHAASGCADKIDEKFWKSGR